MIFKISHSVCIRNTSLYAERLALCQMATNSEPHPQLVCVTLAPLTSMNWCQFTLTEELLHYVEQFPFFFFCFFHFLMKNIEMSLSLAQRSPFLEDLPLLF